jgi:hypothetical protein
MNMQPLPPLSAGDVHEAEGDLYLCPSVRLLADTPGACSYVYDGKGHRLVLPDKQHLGKRRWAASVLSG